MPSRAAATSPRPGVHRAGRRVAVEPRVPGGRARVPGRRYEYLHIDAAMIALVVDPSQFDRDRHRQTSSATSSSTSPLPPAGGSGLAAAGQHQPERRVPVDARARARAPPRHHGQGHRGPDGGDLPPWRCRSTTPQARAKGSERTTRSRRTSPSAARGKFGTVETGDRIAARLG